jgi:mono/diheme cytochrome c family protein
MILARMSRLVRVLTFTASIAAAALLSACGTQKISVPKSDPTYQGAVLFSQRCAGCHTLSYADTHGSATNARSREVTNGPNFNIRCERPVDRVLYAIENGGFSGAIMPQNVVVGQDAQEVAKFVAKYAGRQAPLLPGQTPCVQIPIGSLTLPGAATASTATTATTPAPNTPASSSSKNTPTGNGAGKAKASAGKKKSHP